MESSISRNSWSYVCVCLFFIFLKKLLDIDEYENITTFQGKDGVGTFIFYYFFFIEEKIVRHALTSMKLNLSSVTMCFNHYWLMSSWVNVDNTIGPKKFMTRQLGIWLVHEKWHFKENPEFECASITIDLVSSWVNADNTIRPKKFMTKQLGIWLVHGK